MKAVAISLIAASVAIPSVAEAQRHQPIDQRQHNILNRIDRGVRNGSLTRNEAQRLRTEFRGLERLEYRYRANGLSVRERNDLNRRYDVLSQRVRYERRDRQDRRY